MKKVKTQAVQVVIPSGSAAGQHTVEVSLNREMSHCVGVAMYPIKDGGIDIARIGLRDNKGLIQEVTHQDDWIDKGYGSYHQRKKPVTIEAAGNQVTIVVDIDAATASDLKFDFVFVLMNNPEFI